MVCQPEPGARNWKTVMTFIGIFTTKMAWLDVRVDIAAQYTQLSWREAEEMPSLWNLQTAQNLSVSLGHQSNYNHRSFLEKVCISLSMLLYMVASIWHKLVLPWGHVPPRNPYLCLLLPLLCWHEHWYDSWWIRWEKRWSWKVPHLKVWPTGSLVRACPTVVLVQGRHQKQGARWRNSLAMALDLCCRE